MRLLAGASTVSITFRGMVESVTTVVSASLVADIALARHALCIGLALVGSAEKSNVLGL